MEIYIYNKNKIPKMIFIDVFINNNESLAAFRKIKCDLIRRELITEGMRIFVRADPVFIKSKEPNFSVYCNDLYENILSSGKSQHYSQKFFMNSFIENCEEQSHWFICKIDKNDPNPSNIKNNQFQSTGCSDNYFSKKSDPFLDVFVSAMEEESNDIIRATNKKLKNNDFSFSQTEINNLFNLCALPLFLKSSYNINDFNYCINKSYEHFILENDIPKDNADIFKKEIIDPKSKYYYHCLKQYIIDSFLNKQNYSKFEKIKIVNLKDIPLSENVLFYYKNGLSVGYDNSLNHSIFLFNNKTTFIFYNEYESNDKIIEISDFLELGLIPFIKNNAHDFLVTKERENIKHLKNRTLYSDVDFTHIIKNLYKNIMCLNGKIKSSSFTAETLFFLLEQMDKKDELDDHILFFNKQTTVSPNLIYFKDKEVYITNKDYNYLVSHEGDNYTGKSLSLNAELAEVFYDYSFDNKKNSNPYNPPISINKLSEIKLLPYDYNKIIKTVTFYSKNEEYGIILFLILGEIFFTTYVSEELYDYFQKNAINLISNYEEFCISNNSKIYFFKSYIEEITFNFHDDFTCSYSYILK